MPPPIEQSVVFRASPGTLYEMFMDSARHSAATGGAARISRRPGGRFTAWNRMLSGRTLLLVPNRMIVQSWRSILFKPSDADSILVITFARVARGTRVDLAFQLEEDPYSASRGYPGWCAVLRDVRPAAAAAGA